MNYGNPAKRCWPDNHYSVGYKHALRWVEDKDVQTLHPYGSTDHCPKCSAGGIYKLAAHDMLYPTLLAGVDAHASTKVGNLTSRLTTTKGETHSRA